MGFYSGYRCDNCNNFTEYSVPLSITYARSYARKDGYTVGKRVLCPFCKRGGLTDKDRENIAEMKRKEREKIRHGNN